MASPDDQDIAAPAAATDGEPDGTGARHGTDNGHGRGDPAATQDEIDRGTMSVDAEQPPRLPFTVVGIGASAGGVEALTEFFRAMPAATGMAFVVIQHLPPQRESLMADILSKQTRMPVLQVVDGIRVEPDHVYVIRPGNTLTLRFGALHLGESLERRGHQRPVDDFFRSLAQEQRERAVAVVLSGMGSNGSAGAQMIKAVGGACIAQDPDTAKFPSMPRHLIDAGLSDYVLRPADMAEVLIRYAGHPYARGAAAADVVIRREAKLMAEALAVLRARTRHDFAGYKKPTLIRRVQRRMGLNHVAQLAEYVRLLRQTPGEAKALADDLMIHVTGFFRDPEAWEALRAQVVVPLIAARADGANVRCWVTACSSGEEAYTLAMLVVEEAERAGKQFDVKIFATDMAERSLASARAGVYPDGIVGEVSAERLDRFFDRDDSSYRVKREVRELLVFAPQNVLMDPPFSRMDVCTCRNLLIYLEPDVQRKVLALLHFGLVAGGALFLGTSETLGGADDLFEPMDKRHRIFRRVGPSRHAALDYPPAVIPGTRSGNGGAGGSGEVRQARLSMATAVQRALVERYTPPSIVVDRNGQILYFHGRTEPYLDQPRGEPTRDVMVLARESVRGSLRTALHAAVDKGEPGVVRDGTVTAEDGSTKRVTVRVVPLEQRPGNKFYLVSFDEQPEPRPRPADGDGSAVADAALREELGRAREELQATVEALQTANEEMTAGNEEVTSINEELQSTNEELETSKEELQSLNEELTTVNSQLQAKMEELQATTNDLSSLLSSTDIAVVFLDPQFRIRRFTPAVRDLIELISADVGRPLRDLARKFVDPTLLDDARAVIDRLVPVERDVVSDSGRTYVRRALPYRTTDDRISGVVLTFVDVTDRRRADAAMRVSEQRLRKVVEINSVGVLFIDADGPVDDANDEFLRLSGYTRDDVAAGRVRWDGMTPPEWMDRTRAAMAELRETGRVMPYEKLYRRKDGSTWWGLSAGTSIGDSKGVEFVIDISERHRAESELRASSERVRLAVEVTQMGFWELNPLTGVDSSDATHNRIMGLPADLPPGGIDRVIDHVHPADRDRVAAALNLAARSADELEVQFRAVWPDGSVHHVAKYGRLMADPTQPGGRRLVGTVLDVTARVHAEQAMEQMLAREQAGRQSAEAANEAKDQFLANVSHELRTPLSAILLWAKTLQNTSAAEQQRREGLETIVRAAESQRELIEDLLDTTRITAGKLRLDVRHVAMATVVRDAVDAIRPAADAKRVRLDLDLDPAVDGVHVDPDRLRQVFWNLLSNAVKFTPAGGRVSVAVRRDGDDVTATIADTGRGLPPALLPHVFERFWQAESADAPSAAGLGLGLSIAKQLVELHGGTIAVQSPGDGRGATFQIRLPLPPVGPPRTLPGLAPGSPRTLAGVRVLLVEDDADTRRATLALLRMSEADVTAVATAAAALSAYDADRPDVIVCDIGLPDRDGNELVRDVRTREADRKSPVTPAIALTALARRQDRRRSAESGFQQHLTKPIDPDRLVRTIWTLLER